MCDREFCDMEFPNEVAPDGLNRDSLLKLFQDVLWENSTTQAEYDKKALNIPHIPVDIFNPDEDSDSDDGGGRRGKKHTRKGKKGKGVKKGKRGRRTRYQRGGALTASQKRDKIASIMSLVVYAGSLALLPKGGDILYGRWGSIEEWLVSVELLPTLCTSPERLLEIVLPWGGECALNDELYNTIITRASAAITLTGGAWVAAKGGVKAVIKAPFNWMKTRFSSMLRTLGIKDLADIAQEVREANGDWTDQNIVDFALFYKGELEDAGEAGGIPEYMGKLESVWWPDEDEPDSQDHWGPDYEGLGSKRRRRGRHCRATKRARSRHNKSRHNKSRHNKR